MIDVRIHSSRHLETKITYPIPENREYERDVHYYIFSPAQLHVSAEMIGDAAMLRKFQTHARYSSPEITLDELLDEKNVTSPLYVIEYYVDDRTKGNAEINDNVFITELQTLVNSIRHDTSVVLSECRYLVCVKKDAELDVMLKRWSDEVSQMLGRLRALTERMRIHYPTGNRMVTAFEWADEAISLIVENNSLEMYLALEPLFTQLQGTAQRLLRLSRAELSYRRERSYDSVIGQGNKYSAEAVAYRSGVLKKWAQSVLYLTPLQSKAPERVSGILAGTAAAIAMTFATLAAIFAERFFLKNSMQWALLVIIAYVFKDRIKEGLRKFFNKVVPRLLADQIATFVSPRTGCTLSKAKVIIELTKANKVPQRIRDVRKAKSNPFLDLLPVEDVVHYTRFVQIYKNERSKTMGPWINAMTVITRIRIDDYLKEMDDPSDVMYVSSDEGDFEQQNSERVYHLHLVIHEFSARDNIDQIQHYRVVLNKGGIIRIENLTDVPVSS
ncbi:MAG: hypothetical protein GXY60_00730 [Spirochaetales bacterium]|nr:hypothetical protein [Spirochaetales bacterium]